MTVHTSGTHDGLLAVSSRQFHSHTDVRIDDRFGDDEIKFFRLAAVALALLPLRCSLLVAAASTASSSLTSAFSSDLGFFLLCRAYEVFFVRSAADRLDRAGVRSRWCAQVAQDVRPMRTGDELGPTRCRRRHHE